MQSGDALQSATKRKGVIQLLTFAMSPKRPIVHEPSSLYIESLLHWQSKLSIVVLPLRAGRNCFSRVPMLYNFATVDAKQIIK